MGRIIHFISICSLVKHYHKSDHKKMESTIVSAENINAYYGESHAIKNINIKINRNEVVAMMGPSGCGKTTFLRCINRMHELIPNARAEGVMKLDGEGVYKMNAIYTRSKIGMVFQRPNPFPNMSIYENVIAGYLLNGISLPKAEKDSIVEKSLTSAALWKEVKDSLHKKGTFLSGGQQQRLCIARAIAMKPEVLLLDEPTSALDPISTSSVENLFHELKQNYTLIIVTHNMQQEARVRGRTAFFYLGELVEFDDTKVMFTNPKDQRTQNYITGRFS